MLVGRTHHRTAFAHRMVVGLRLGVDMMVARARGVDICFGGTICPCVGVMLYPMVDMEFLSHLKKKESGSKTGVHTVLRRGRRQVFENILGILRTVLLLQ